MSILSISVGELEDGCGGIGYVTVELKDKEPVELLYSNIVIAETVAHSLARVNLYDAGELPPIHITQIDSIASVNAGDIITLDSFPYTDKSSN